MTGVVVVFAMYGLVFLGWMGLAIAEDQTDPWWVKWALLVVLGLVVAVVIFGVTLAVSTEDAAWVAEIERRRP